MNELTCYEQLTLDKIGKVSISLTGTRSSKDRIGRLLRYDSSSTGLTIKTRGGSAGHEEVYRIKSKNTRVSDSRYEKQA